MMNHDQRCVQCNEVPHQALTLICSNPNCRNLVCGTNSQRSHCIYHHLIRHGHRVLWNRTQQRAEIGACAACGGTILDVKMAEMLRPVCNDHRRKCDHHIHGAACYYWGKHEDIERHVQRCHTFSGMFDQNCDGGLEYKTEDDDRDFIDVSGMRCFFCKDVPHQPLKLKCNGRAKCAHSICGTSEFRSNCIDKFLREGAVVKWDMTNESLLLSRCPSRDGGVTLIEMQSPEVTEYYNGKQRKCDWEGENGKQCDDRNFVEGNHYEIEEHIRSYHLHIEANEDDDVNDDGEGRGEGNGHEFDDDDDPDNIEDAAMESDDQEQSTVSSVASCSRHRFQRRLAFLFGIADFSDLPAGINKLGVFDVSSPISSMSTGHQHMTVSKKLQVLITMIAGNSKCAAKNLKKASKPIDDSVRRDFEGLTVCCVLQSKAGEAGQGKWKSTSNAVIEEKQLEDND